jgi:hypothetical protein
MKRPFKVLVCGQRDFEDHEFLFQKLDDMHQSYWQFSEVIEGGAPGADQLGGTWAMNNGIALRVFPANWKKYGKAAGPIRNQQMLDEGLPDMVVAFYHNKASSKGTKDMVGRAWKTLGPGNIFEFEAPPKINEVR